MVNRLASMMASTDINHVLTPLQLGSGRFIELAIIFFVLAIIAAVLGARGIAGLSMDIAKWLIIIFIVLAVLSIVL